ncbi:hypothetical protein DPEC_G00379430 [Dallia pectoralis]|nr:hypothetical protein DPEC_G00379430 [Dallia pectoralis]
METVLPCSFLPPPLSRSPLCFSPSFGPFCSNLIQVPREQRRVKVKGSRLQGFGSHSRENRHCRPSMKIPGSYNKSGRAVCPSVSDDPDTRGPSQSDLSSEEELSGEEGGFRFPYSPNPTTSGITSTDQTDFQ